MANPYKLDQAEHEEVYSEIKYWPLKSQTPQTLNLTRIFRPSSTRAMT